MNHKAKQGGLKEMLRKTIVSLKRKPQTIPMLVLAAAFLYYSLNLTHVSDTTAKIQSQGMGLSGFCTMLFSMLSFVCFLNAYPHRKKTNIPMLVLMLLMVAGLIFCDTYYMGCISRAITRPDHPIAIEAATQYIQQAYDMLGVHRIILIVGFVLTLLVPVLRNLLRKIDTSLPVEEGSQMESLHLSQED
ncbi:MAG: hypothetical protein E7323_04585 [Clostridiales bacterium]|nr:hypothetical protein [Clostridiales bacterium]